MESKTTEEQIAEMDAEIRRLKALVEDIRKKAVMDPQSFIAMRNEVARRYD